jgi:hypothetical protein
VRAPAPPPEPAPLLDDVDVRTKALAERRICAAAEAAAGKHLAAVKANAGRRSQLVPVTGRIAQLQLQLEGMATKAELLVVDDCVKQTDEVLQEERQQRHSEVAQINSVLKALELLCETQDTKYAAQRKAGIVSQLRKSVFHMMHRQRARAFESWCSHSQGLKRARNLLAKGLGKWRNRNLAVSFGPWLTMWRNEMEQRRTAAMEKLMSSSNVVTEQLEARVHGPC